MLVLSRKEGEAVYIGDDIKVTITRINGGKVRIGIETGEKVSVLRGELFDAARSQSARSQSASVKTDYKTLVAIN